MRSLGPAEASDVNLRQILDGSLAFIGLLSLDGTLVEANALALQAGGLTREDVIGKKFWDCYWWDYDEQVRAELKAAHLRAVSGDAVRYDVRVRVAGGNLMWIDFQLVPMRNAEGLVTHLIPSGLDLTQKKDAEHALKNSEQKFRGVFDNAFVGVALVGLDGRWLEVNDRLCELLGYSRQELVTNSFQDITHPDDLQDDLDHVASLLAGQTQNYKMDKRYIRRDGSILWASLTVALQRDLDGGPSHFISIINDISERVRAQQHQKMLMSELAHRLKNQLAIVQAMSGQSAKDAATVEEFHKKLVGRLSALAASADLLIQQDRSDISLSDLVNKTLKAFPHIEVEGDHVTISGEAVEVLALAFHELATNSTKHGAWSAPQGFVKMRWNKDYASDALCLSWIEGSGPPVHQPERSGFGQMIIEKVVAQKLHADVRLEYHPDGLRWQAIIPRSSM